MAKVTNDQNNIILIQQHAERDYILIRESQYTLFWVMIMQL